MEITKNQQLLNYMYIWLDFIFIFNYINYLDIKTSEFQ